MLTDTQRDLVRLTAAAVLVKDPDIQQKISALLAQEEVELQTCRNECKERPTA